jgi:DNA-directed RNA polymerase specialized sigma24 family protein
VSPSISGAILKDLLREAANAAAQLVRRFQLPAHERDDLSHDLLVDLLSRLKDFDPCRGTLAGFAAIIIRHGVTRIAARLHRDRTVFGGVSLDDPISRRDGATLGDTVAEEDGYVGWMGPRTNPISALEVRLSVNRALNTLPPEQLNLCAKLLAGPIGHLCAEQSPSRATLYRQLSDVRLRLLAAGLGPTPWDSARE